MTSKPIRVQIPFHLQTLAQCEREVTVNVVEPVSVGSAVRALEARYPMLSGTVIDHYTGQRQPKVRFFACGEDVSLLPLDTPLAEGVVEGREPLMIVGAISGG